MSDHEPDEVGRLFGSLLKESKRRDADLSDLERDVKRLKELNEKLKGKKV